MRHEVPPLLDRLIRHQDGVVSRRQVLEHVSPTPLRRLLRDEWLLPVTSGVYRRPETTDIVARAWAGHLIAGPGSALGGRIVLHRAGLVDAPTLIETWTPPTRATVSPRRGWVFRQDGESRLTRARGTLPCVPLEVALVDAGATLDLERWVGLVLDAVQASKTSLDRVRSVLAARRRGRERAERLEVLGDLLGQDSILEARFARDVERAHGLPIGDRQQSVSEGTRTDVRYREWATLVELDGTLGHDGSGVFRDLWRDNAHAVGSDVTLRYGSVDTHARPCAVAFQMALRFRSQGWAGDFQSCRRCPPIADLASLAAANGWTPRA